MAINTTTRQTTAFTSGNNFAFDFKVYEVGDVKVIQIQTSNGAETVLTITTHYTVTLNDDQNANPGGTVTLVSSGSPQNLATGYNIVITSKVSPLQQTEITNQGGFFPEVINDVFDKAAILDQQQQNILDKCIRFPLTQTVGGLEITENAANRANKIPQFDGSGDLVILATVDGRDVSADGAKLDTIETGATADQTIGEIKALIAGSPLDASHLAADAVTVSELAANSVDSSQLVDGSIDTQHIGNEQVDTSKIAPDAINSTKIQDNSINSEHYVDGSIDRIHLEADIIDSSKLADNSVNSEHYVDGSIDHVHLAADIVDGDNIADNSINSEHYVDGSIDHEHLANDIINSDNIQDDVVNSEHIVAGAIDNEHYAAGSITVDKIDGATVVTASEQASAASNDTSFLTVAAADARFFNISTGDTIKDGDTFPDNDTTIATTAAINDRIIDLVDDVGGFVPIANETSFPTANPDAENGTGTVVSVKAASTNLTPSGTTVTIANGAGTGNTVTITGVPSVIPSGFGFLVETTTNTHEYTFHRLVPKATEVTTVAGKATEITRLGTADAVADMAILGTTDVVADMNMLATSDVVADMALLATTDVIADMALLADSSVISDLDTLADIASNITTVAGISSNVTTVAGISSQVTAVAADASDIGLVAGSITNVNNVGGSITNVNTVANNLSSVNSFANQYRIGANNPTDSLDVGDLFYNTTSQSLKVYTGSAWVDGVTQTGNFALKTGNTFTGSNVHNDNVKSIYGTSSDGLEIYHNGNDSIIDDVGSGALRLQRAGVTKLSLTSGGIDVVGNITVSGNVDGRDVAADGTKLDGIESGATADQSASDIKTLLNSSGLVNAQIDASAAIAGTKISPDFGSQNVATTGTLGSSDITITSTEPTLNLVDSNDNPDYKIHAIGGQFRITDATAGAHRLVIHSSGNFDVSGNINAAAGVDVTGNITVTGTVDGRDVAADGTKLDGIESNATADQTSSDIKSLLASDNLTSAHLAADSVGTSEIAADAITQAEIANDAVRMEHILAGNVTDSELASDAVTTVKIANNAVTFAKLEDVAQNHIVGRISSGTGDAQELNAGEVRTLLNVEDGATGDQTAAEIRTLVGNASDSNVFTDALLSKLNGIAASATNVTNTNQLTNGAGFITSADGGNAATLDSIDSSQFLRSDAADSASALITLSGGVHIGAARASANVEGLNYASTMTVDFSSGVHHAVTLTGNGQLSHSNLANATGQSGSIFIKQDSSGSRVLTYSSAYKFAGGVTPTLSTGADQTDRLDYVVRDSSTIHCVLSLNVS